VLAAGAMWDRPNKAGSPDFSRVTGNPYLNEKSVLQVDNQKEKSMLSLNEQNIFEGKKICRLQVYNL
jgi:hypothetical protein